MNRPGRSHWRVNPGHYASAPSARQTCRHMTAGSWKMASARPRPRPRARVKTADEVSSSADASSSSVPVVTVVDDDAMFIRKRNPAAWKKFAQENKGGSRLWLGYNGIRYSRPILAPAKQKAAHSDSEHDSDSPRPRKQKKKSGDTAQAKINRYTLSLYYVFGAHIRVA